MNFKAFLSMLYSTCGSCCRCCLIFNLEACPTLMHITISRYNYQLLFHDTEDHELINTITTIISVSFNKQTRTSTSSNPPHMQYCCHWITYHVSVVRMSRLEEPWHAACVAMEKVERTERHWFNTRFSVHHHVCVCVCVLDVCVCVCVCVCTLSYSWHCV